MTVVRREVSDRTFLGKVVKWLFILFNLLMIAWVVSGLIAVGQDMDLNSMSDAEAAGAGLGIAVGLGAIGTIWVMGDIVLGLLVLLTRRKKIIETEE
jgi:hypothetical protein